MSEQERKIPENRRKPEAGVDAIFPDRWSPRAMSAEPIDQDTIDMLFEAARWAPSCYNEQPWLFLYATDGDERERFNSLLIDWNKTWASKAPLLIFLFGKRRFDMTGEDNRWHAFDSGAAWMALALQARRLGLYAHGMAGYKKKKAYEVLGVNEDDYEVIAAIAVGKYGDPDQLPEDMLEKEYPNERKPLDEVAKKGALR